MAKLFAIAEKSVINISTEAFKCISNMKTKSINSLSDSCLDFDI